MRLPILAFLGCLIGAGIAGLAPVTTLGAEPATQQKPEISAEASAALQRMGETLRAQQFSFQAQTIRVYAGPKGEPLHIFHTLDVTVSRPNRLLVSRNGDDGPGKLVYDGKTLMIYMGDANKYASIPVPGTIEGMMKEAMGRLGVDFPLADFLTDAPSKAFLSGVTEGEVVNTDSDRRRSLPSHVLLAAAGHRTRTVAGKERPVVAAAADRDLPVIARPAEFYRDLFRLEFLDTPG